MAGYRYNDIAVHPVQGAFPTCQGRFMHVSGVSEDLPKGVCAIAKNSGIGRSSDSGTPKDEPRWHIEIALTANRNVMILTT